LFAHRRAGDSFATLRRRPTSIFGFEVGIDRQQICGAVDGEAMAGMEEQRDVGAPGGGRSKPFAGGDDVAKSGSGRGNYPATGADVENLVRPTGEPQRASGRLISLGFPGASFAPSVHVTYITSAALNPLYGPSIQTLSSSEDDDHDEPSQIFRFNGDDACCRAVDDGRPCHRRRQ
jgi:hypothetical protein